MPAVVQTLVSFGETTFCKVGNNHYRVRIRGEALEIADFEFPPTGDILRYSPLPAGGVPLLPIDSAGNPHPGSAPLTLDPASGAFTYESEILHYDNTASPMYFVIWMRYDNHTGQHFNVGAITVLARTQAQVGAMVDCP
jgi:hypothetical protein